jgi:hypothetical protein
MNRPRAHRFSRSDVRLDDAKYMKAKRFAARFVR